MVIAVEKKTLTADDLLRMNANGLRGELIRGVLCETMPASEIHGAVVTALVILIGVFIQPRELGVLTASDSGVWLERDPDTVREPDIAFFSTETAPPGSGLTRGYSETVPDLVVEVRSPRDSLAAMNDKALMWLSHGARMVWNVHPDDRTVDVYRPNRPVITLAEGDTLDGYDVIPGFTCGISRVFGFYAYAE